MARVVVLGAGISGHTAATFLRKWLGINDEVVVVSPLPRNVSAALRDGSSMNYWLCGTATAGPWSASMDPQQQKTVAAL